MLLSVEPVRVQNRGNFFSNTNYLQIEAIFDLGDVDGDGTIDMDEFVGKRLKISSWKKKIIQCKNINCD